MNLDVWLICALKIILADAKPRPMVVRDDVKQEMRELKAKMASKHI